MKEVIPLIRLRHIGSLLQVICEVLRRTLAPGTDDERDEGKKEKDRREEQKDGSRSSS